MRYYKQIGGNNERDGSKSLILIFRDISFSLKLLTTLLFGLVRALKSNRKVGPTQQVIV